MEHNARPIIAVIYCTCSHHCCCGFLAPLRRWAPNSHPLPLGDRWPSTLMDSTLFFLSRDGLAGSLPSRDPVHHAFSSSLGTYHCQSGPARTCPPPGTWGSSKASRCGLLYHHLVSTKAATRLLPVGPAARHCHPPCTRGSD